MDTKHDPPSSPAFPPASPWIMYQTWSRLLFAHWPVDPAELRALIPASLPIDTFNGQAWVGVVPFYMSGVRFRYMPAIPTTREFCELNVRTYVVPTGGRPGVWFFSLDASSGLAVRGARQAFRLPYYNARMNLRRDGDRTYYQSQRVHRGAPDAAFRGRYGPVSPVFKAQPGTLEHWLTERYCLYTADRTGRIYRGDIVHTPWPLQQAEADITVNTMADAAGIVLPEQVPLLHYAERLDVKAAYLRAVR